MNLRFILMGTIIFFFLFYACTDDSSSPYNPQTIYIDEPIVLEVSAFLSASVNWQGDFVFDFNGVILVQTDAYNDFELTYWTSSSCDEDVWVYNFRKRRWDQIGFSPGPGIMCFTVITEQGHLFSARGLEAKDYLEEDLEMRVKGSVSGPKVRALKINPDYFIVPIRLENVRSFNGLVHDGESLWISSNSSDRIYNLSLEGKIIKEFEALAGYPFGLAFDGQDLWLADGSDRIFKMDQEGDVLCQFTVPTDYPGGLTWENDKLWLSEYEHMYGISQLFGIDPYASCSAGFAVITDTFDTPEGGSTGLAWDGEYLLVVIKNPYSEAHKLYKIKTSGEVIQSYDIPVKFPKDIAWDGEAVWLLNYGPKDLINHDPVITRFKLR
ncbi:MAG: hypothetical protein E3J76_00095 [Candidatus Aminicenantes bacterium]|nr:MAG: hypothetical protein E3J76_00095 [Candidatus Aminicenantes bacterium]